MLKFFIAIIAAICSTAGVAASFEIAISPSRFELSGKSGTRVGQSMEIFNVGASATEVSIRSLDWAYSADGGITYSDELAPGSCRPWVTLERKSLRIPAKGKAAFRFQVEVPPTAPRGECRFMLAVEGIEPAYKAVVEGGGASLSLPVSGRIAVVVYLAVNGAESRLALTQVGMSEVRGKRVPTVVVTNTGDAHGRLDGSLDAVDAKGVEFELVPEGTPVLPGQTRTLPLTPRIEASQKAPEVTYPVKSSGTLDWEKGSFKVNAEFK